MGNQVYKTNGLPGKRRRYYRWDFTHKDIENYDSNGNDIGSSGSCDFSFKIYRPPQKGRSIRDIIRKKK